MEISCSSLKRNCSVLTHLCKDRFLFSFHLPLWVPKMQLYYMSIQPWFLQQRACCDRPLRSTISALNRSRRRIHTKTKQQAAIQNMALYTPFQFLDPARDYASGLVKAHLRNRKGKQLKERRPNQKSRGWVENNERKCSWTLNWMAK